MQWNMVETQAKLADTGRYLGPIDGEFGRDSWAALLASVARRTVTDQDRALGACFPTALAAVRMDNPLVIAHFLAQLAVESRGFAQLTENLSYSAERLMAVWSTRFPTLATTQGFVRNPEALANKVYARRLGNGDAASGDGWRYRGRGLIQLTGRKNYAAREKDVALPLIAQPELAADPKHAVMIAARFWQKRDITPLALRDDLNAVRMAVNGGTHGIMDSKVYLARAKALLLSR